MVNAGTESNQESFSDAGTTLDPSDRPQAIPEAMPFNDLAHFFAEQGKLAQERLDAHKVQCRKLECAECELWPCSECRVAQRARGPNVCDGCYPVVRRREWADSALKTLPAMSEGVTLDTEWLGKLVGADIIARAKRNPRPVVATFVGKPRSGKTSLACAMFRAFVASESDTRWQAQHLYITASDIVKHERSHPLGVGESKLQHRLRRSPLLLINELGSEGADAGETLKNLITARTDDLLPTWSVVVCGFREATDRYGGGVGDRLFGKDRFENWAGFHMGKTS